MKRGPGVGISADPHWRGCLPVASEPYKSYQAGVFPDDGIVFGGALLRGPRVVTDPGLPGWSGGFGLRDAKDSTVVTN